MTTNEDRHDIAVIGAGITGMTAALALARQGARVCLYDACENAGSTTNAGSLHVQLQSRFLRLFPEQAPNVEASLPLYLTAVADWDALDALLGGVELSREGGLMVAETNEQLAFLHEKAEREARHGLRVDILERAALERIAPYLGPDVIGAEICHDEGKLNPLIANARLRTHLLGLGVAFRAEKVTAIQPEGRHVRVNAGRTEVHDLAVLATSWATGDLTGSLGLPLPTMPEPLHMNITEPADYAIRHLIQHSERPITLKQFASGQIVIGGGWPAQLEDAERTPGVVADSVLGNIGLAGRIVPGIGGLRLLRTWAGLNTVADGKSILGRLPGAERVIVAIPGDAGYTLGPAIGKAAAAIALGETPDFDAAPYAPDRFG